MYHTQFSFFRLSSSPSMMVRPQAYFLASRTSNSDRTSKNSVTGHSLALQDNCSPTIMIEDASAIIVQAVAFAAAEILHKEESSVSSRAGRIAVGRVRRSVHEVYRCHGKSYFQRAYRMSYESFWNLHTKLAQELIVPDLQCTVMCQRGGERGVNLSCHPYEMGEL